MDQTAREEAERATQRAQREAAREIVSFALGAFGFATTLYLPEHSRVEIKQDQPNNQRGDAAFECDLQKV